MEINHYPNYTLEKNNQNDFQTQNNINILNSESKKFQEIIQKKINNNKNINLPPKKQPEIKQIINHNKQPETQKSRENKAPNHKTKSNAFLTECKYFISDCREIYKTTKHKLENQIENYKTKIYKTLQEQKQMLKDGKLSMKPFKKSGIIGGGVAGMTFGLLIPFPLTLPTGLIIGSFLGWWYSSRIVKKVLDLIKIPTNHTKLA